MLCALAFGAGAQSLYQESIRPVVEKQCLTCHNATVKQGGLDLSSRDKMIRGGDRGPAIVPGQPSESLLLAYISHSKKPGMPLGGAKLSPELIAKFEEWIKSGAPDGGGVAAVAAPSHWSFRKPSKGAVPKPRDAAWAPNPVDAFLAAGHDKRGLRAAPEADRYTLLRRLYIDLIGMTPTATQVEAFITDKSPDAYEKVVDDLLASKHYGERWGRHWMDIWRYSDWYGSGSEVRSSHRHIWRWRDWIIESLNQDKGYDAMVEEMLAGDEIAPTDEKTLAATGFLARNWFRFNRNVWLVDTVEATTASFLGVTLKCARCHDHKYDPFPQQDYYRFRAVFEPHDIRIDRVPGQPDRKKAGLARVYDSAAKDAGPDLEGGNNLMPQIFDKTYLFIRGDENNPDKEQEMQPGTPRVLGGPPLQMSPVEIPVEAFYSDIRPFVADDLVKEAKAAVKAVDDQLGKLRAELERAKAEAAKQMAEASGPNVDFAEVKAIFEESCSACHLGRNGKGGLSIGSEQAIRTGGKSGPAVVAGRSGESILIQFLKGEKQPRMPLNGPPVAGSKIDLIARWVDGLPHRKPGDIVKENPVLITAAEKEKEAALAAVVALEARVKAEHAKYAKPPSAELEKLHEAAVKAEREANLLKAEEQLFRAQHKMSEAMAEIPKDDDARKARDRAVAAAKKQVQAALDALSKPVDAYTPLGPVHMKVSTGRRLALARWITSPENPLAARVAVNHVWGRHFGKPLAANVIDFGKNGKAPSNPDLLDWLAVDFRESGWKMKRLHRLIVTSKAYRMESRMPAADHVNVKIDRDNTYLWRMNSRRMEAEVVRDSVLRISDALDTKMGGPELHEETEQDTARRSLYFHITPSAQMEFLKVFDGPDPGACYVRNESIVPQQALALANSKLSLEHSIRVTDNLGGVSKPAPEFVREAFLTVLARPATPVEEGKSLTYLARRETLAKEANAESASLRARQSLVRALFNRDEFVSIR
jgi:mono/diheme cytochrome c family protein